MLFFESDYTEGACDEILKKLLESNYEKLSGYGNDKYTESAKEKIRKACNCPNADIFFLVGGTQTNAVVIDSLLKSYEGVIAAKTGHISSHESGAIEYTGHKILELPEHDGKINPVELENYINTFWQDGNHEHMVFPGMVYISQSTEYGTIYNKSELNEISNVCKKFNIPLYIDGARLGYGLTCRESDLNLESLAKACDVFYIGGTKVGALCGEAVVFPKGNSPQHFFTIIKQRGALLAKGRLLGIQFDTLFTNDLYIKISTHANNMAELLRQGYEKRNYSFFINSPTNQQFIILENTKMNVLQEYVKFSFWEKFDYNNTVVRFATSWATKEEDIHELFEILDKI